MKKVLLLLTVATLLFGCSDNTLENKKNESKEQENKSTTTHIEEEEEEEEEEQPKDTTLRTEEDNNYLGKYKINEFRYKNMVESLTYEFMNIEILDNIDDYKPVNGKFLIIHTQITPGKDMSNTVKPSSFLVTLPSELKSDYIIKNFSSGTRIKAIISENEKDFNTINDMGVSTYYNLKNKYIKKTENEGIKTGYDVKYISLEDTPRKRAVIFDVDETIIHDDQTHIIIKLREMWGKDEEFPPYKLYINTKEFLKDE